VPQRNSTVYSRNLEILCKMSVTTKKQRNPRRRQGRARKGPSRKENQEVQAIYNQIVAKKSTGGKKRAPRNRGRGRGKMAGMNPTFGNGGTNLGRRVSFPINEVFVQNFQGTTAFTQSTFAINPGNPALFPYLSSLAQKFERYEFSDLCFHYKPSAGILAAEGAQGFVDISATNDAKQSPPSNQQQAEIFQHFPNGPILPYKESGKLHLSRMFLESSTKQKHFVRPNGLIPGGADPHLYDCGQIFAWTNNFAANGNAGELRVTGTCVLINPVLEASTTPPVNFNATDLFTAGATAMPATTVPVTVPFAGVTVNSCAVVNAAGVLTPPLGNYMVDWELDFTGVGTAMTNSSVQLQKNGVVYGNLDAVAFLAAAGNTANSQSQSYYVACNGTDTLQVIWTPTYTGTAGTYGANIRLLAV